jgi:hypothetical protein
MREMCRLLYKRGKYKLRKRQIQLCSRQYKRRNIEQNQGQSNFYLTLINNSQ